LVIYNASGTNVSATYVDRQKLPLRFVVDHKLYWLTVAEPAEAHYLTAIFNADATNHAIKPFQSTGLLGERDVHKKLLDLPIPLFDSKKLVHRELATLGIEAYRQAKAAIRDGNFPADTSLARQRAYIRTALEGTLLRIDDLVRALLGLGKK
jgi:hypothetical protein